MDYLIIAFISIAIGMGIGFVIGLRSKAQAKIKRREKAGESKTPITDAFNKSMEQAKQELKEGRQAPPPPPPARVIREGKQPQKPLVVSGGGSKLYQKDKPVEPVQNMIEHISPSMFYKKGAFVSVNQCKNCKAIGQDTVLWWHKPCPKCGGKVKELGAAKWVGDYWEMSKA